VPEAFYTSPCCLNTTGGIKAQKGRFFISPPPHYNKYNI